MSNPFTAWLDGVQIPWLQGVGSRARLDAFADVLETERLRLVAGVKERMPSEASAAGLAELAVERGIEPRPGESQEDLALRVRGAWDLWRAAGRAAGVLVALYYAGWPYDTLAISQQNGIVHKLVQWPPDTSKPFDAVQVYTLHDVPWRGYPWCQIDPRDEWANKFFVMAKGDPAAVTAERLAAFERVVQWFKPATAIFTGFYVALDTQFGHWQYITGDETGDIATGDDVIDGTMTGEVTRLGA